MAMGEFYENGAQRNTVF